MSLIIIGQFFPPINGCSLANEVLIKHLEIRNESYHKVNTSIEGLNDKKLGHFSIKKSIPIIRQYKNIYKIKDASLLYTTPGQTFLGIIKYAPFYIASTIFRVPYIIHVHGNFLGKQYEKLTGLRRWLFKVLISNAALGIVLSESLRPLFNGLLPKERVSVVGNFAQDFLCNQNLAKSSDCLKILYLSNLIAYKGIFEVLRAVEILRLKGIPFELHLAGGIDNSIKESLLDSISNVPEITYHGTVSGNDKKELLEKCNVFCLPTYYEQEGQPISLLEGMLTGNIIITTKHAGIPDIVSEENGFFCEKKSPESIASILEVISNDIAFYVNKFSIHNTEYVKNNFSETVFADNLITLFHDVAKVK